MSVLFQLASTTLWSDETHVKANRDAYREKFRAVAEILNDVLPLRFQKRLSIFGPQIPIDDETFARELLRTQNVAVLPGRYLGRSTAEGIPAPTIAGWRWLQPSTKCVEAAHRIRQFVESIKS